MQEQESGNNTATIEQPKTLDELVSRTFNPPQKPVEAAPAPVVPEVAPVEPVKSEEKPAEKPAEKKPSIFDSIKADEKNVATKPVEVTNVDPFKDIKDGDWKALKTASKAREQAIAAQVEAERKQREAIAAERDTLKKQLDEYHTKVPDTSEVERLRKEHKEASERLKLLDYQSTPEFRQKYLEPKNQAVSYVKQILTENGVTQDIDLVRLTEKPRIEYAKAVSEIAEQLNSHDAGEFRLQMREIQKLTQAEKTAIGEHGQNLAALQERNKALQRSAFEQVIKERSLPAFAEKQVIDANDSPEIKQLKESFNAELGNYRSDAEQAVFSVANEYDAARVGVEATNFRFLSKTALPLIKAMYDNVVAERDALSERLKGLETVKPETGVDKGKAPGSGVAQTFEEKMRELGIG